MFEIKSVDSDLKFTFTDIVKDSFKIIISSNSLNTVREVYSFTDSDGIAKLLEELASKSTPWPGREEWESLEGEFKISATCNHFGHVKFCIEIHQIGSDEDWSVNAELKTEFGQLPKIAKSARKCFIK